MKGCGFTGKINVVVQGSLLFDFFIKAKTLPKLGQTVIGDSFGMFSGGKGANQAVQLARLGAGVIMIGRVGHDFMGDFLLDKLKAEGMDVSYITRDDTLNTGLCTVSVDESGKNAIIVVPLSNSHCCREDIYKAEKHIAEADILLCQLETTVEAAEAAIELAAHYNVRAVLNPAPAVIIPDRLFEKVYLLTPNETEAEFFTGVSLDEYQPEEWRILAAKRLHEMGAREVIITLGAQGCYHSDGTSGTHYPAFEITAVDTTAAGDAFNAALCYSLACKKSIAEAIRYGNGAGALAASRFGSQVSLCNLEELEKFFEDRGN